MKEEPQGKCPWVRFLVALCVLLSTVNATKTHEKQPNFLMIIADDLGYGDLNFLSAHNFRPVAPTPNLDALAHGGVIFREAYAAESVCTPSRSAMLTGRYPSRSGMSSSDPDFRTLISPAQKTGLPHSEVTVAEALQEQGYVTALIGKWHLGIGEVGEYLPTAHGFDYYYGMPVTNVQTCGGKTIFKESNLLLFAIVRLWNIWVSMGIIVFFTRLFRIAGNKMTLFLVGIIILCIGGAHWYLDNVTMCARSSCLLYRNEDIVEQPVRLQNLTLRFTHEATEFLRRQSEQVESSPWFLKMSYVKVHTALFTSTLFNGSTNAGEFGDNVAEMDWSVGKLMDALEEYGFLEDTLVIFTSDNGPYLEEYEEGGSSGYVHSESDNSQQYLKGGKGQNWEGGIRVPTLFYWADSISPRVVKQPVSLMDFYPTMLKLAGHPGVTDRIIDGRDLSPVLFGEEDAQDPIHQFLFHWCGSTLHAMRYGDWKVHWITPIWDEGTNHCDSVVICHCYGRRVTVHDPPLLYNIREDASESSPYDPQSEIYQTIMARMNEGREEHTRTFELVPNQLESFPRPWLMPCCQSNSSDTSCTCEESNNAFEYLLEEAHSKTNPQLRWRNLQGTPIPQE